ncbi:hypothetical protein E1301_Tti015967 [Triplophysa tibetana]|uniref:Uncharacterized protein n=1 Tax=Triplophysa tibetana TaxID=1572043 RepID=A0A5A9PBT9_9TELE|nr:hypothetical protein E1301_Tti015967 [Triplophysa tibetana]
MEVEQLAEFDLFYFKGYLATQPEERTRDLMDFSAHKLPGHSCGQTPGVSNPELCLVDQLHSPKHDIGHHMKQ